MKRTLLLALAAVLLAGCEHSETELRIGASPWPGNAPVFLAADDGRLGAGVRVVEFSSETAALQAFRNRALDVAVLTLDEALLLAGEGHGVRIVALTDLSAGAGVMLARPPLGDVASLRGRRIGVESTGTGGFILAHALRLAGLAVADVQIVSLLPHEQAGEYAAGRIDVAVSHEPFAERLRALGARPVFDTRQMEDDLIRAVVVRDSRLNEHRRRVGELVRALLAGRAAFAGDAGLARAARRYRQTPEEFRQAYAGVRPLTEADNRAYFADDARRLRDVLAHVQDEMLEARLIAAPVDLAKLPVGVLP